MRTQTISVFSVWNQYKDVPAIHAAGIVSVFFCAAFLNFGWMALIFLGYAFLAALASLSKRKGAVRGFIDGISLEASMLAFGLFFSLCFHAWLPAFPSLHPTARMALWLAYATVLLSAKFFLITRLFDAFADARLFARRRGSFPRSLLAFVLLVASVAMFVFAGFGPDAQGIADLFVQSIVPGIL